MTALAAADRLPLVTTDLDELLRQVAQRDVDAFATFYDRTRAGVFGLAARVPRDPGYSEETTGTLPPCTASAGSYDPAAGSPLAWLLTWHTAARWTGCVGAGRQSTRIPVRSRKRRSTGGPRRRVGDPA